MGTKLYVGNLPYTVRDDTLAETFASYGTVTSAKVIMERDNHDRSRGFGFVEMASDEEAQAAIAGLHDQPMEGRNLVVNEARPMTPRAPRGGGGGYGGGGNRRDGGFRNPYGTGARGGRRGGHGGGHDDGGY